MLNFLHLQTLRAVLESGSFSAAGRKLDYTTSAVSQQIASLERSLGVQLFERGARSLWPTAAAYQIDETAGGVLLGIDEFENQVRAAARRGGGRLRIASFASIGSRLLPSALALLVEQFPDADFPVSEGRESSAVIEAVSSMRADLGLVFAYPPLPVNWSEDLVVVPVLDEEIVVLAGRTRGATLEPTVKLASLADETWVAHHPDSAGRVSFDYWCSTADFTPKVMFETNNFDTLRGVVRENLALGLIPSLALGVDRTITMHRLTDVNPHRKVYLIYRKADRNPLLQEAERAIFSSADHFISWTREGFETDEMQQALASRL